MNPDSSLWDTRWCCTTSGLDSNFTLENAHIVKYCLSTYQFSKNGFPCFISDDGPGRCGYESSFVNVQNGLHVHVVRQSLLNLWILTEEVDTRGNHLILKPTVDNLAIYASKANAQTRKRNKASQSLFPQVNTYPCCPLCKRRTLRIKFNPSRNKALTRGLWLTGRRKPKHLILAVENHTLEIISRTRTSGNRLLALGSIPLITSVSLIEGTGKVGTVLEEHVLRGVMVDVWRNELWGLVDDEVVREVDGLEVPSMDIISSLASG